MKRLALVLLGIIKVLAEQSPPDHDSSLLDRQVRRDDASDGAFSDDATIDVYIVDGNDTSTLENYGSGTNATANSTSGDIDSWSTNDQNITQVQNFTVAAGNGTSNTNFDSDGYVSIAARDLDKRDMPLLRIMPLGASITAGVHSLPEDGYRKHLRNWLRQAGFPVNMVGSQTNPTSSMKNGVHEGFPGKRILEVANLLDTDGWLDHQPNVVIIHLGTNNCIQNRDYQNGASDLAALVINIVQKVPGVHVIMSTLGPIHDSAANSRCVNTLNPGIRDQYHSLVNQGYNVGFADMGQANGYITANDINDDDGVHPTDAGYVKYATMFYYAIKDAYDAGHINTAVTTKYPDKSSTSTGGTGSKSGNTCDKVAGNAYGPVDTQFGKAGQDDGPYHHSSNKWGKLKWEDGKDIVFTNKSGGDSSEHLLFAQLVNSNGDKDRHHIQEDLMVYYSQNDELCKPADTCTKGKNGRVWTNIGDGKFSKTEGALDVDDGPGCLIKGVRWADVNNDGLDDYICIGAAGDMYVSLNRGGFPPKFEHVGLYKANVGLDQDHVLILDVDGDGRFDYCVTAGNGDISCWRNSGTTQDKPTHWQELGVVFTGQNMGTIKGTHFLDVNGDGRSDWVWVHNDTGATRIFGNGRGRYEGLKPYWLEASNSHPGTGQDDAIARLRFPRLFARDTGSRADYVRISNEKVKGVYTQTCDVWENTGTGGTKEKADGNRYCDMTGSGRDDLVWVKSTGEIELWPNVNTNGHLQKPWHWGKSYQVMNFNADGAHRDRRGIHLADWNGDGYCDVIYHDHVSGNVEWWENLYDKGKKTVAFTFRGNIPGKCAQGIGIGLFDLGLRFADIDGDGRADWLCMEPNGRTTGYLNHASGLLDIGQIKKSEGHERANLRWADVNGDGRADLLWANALTGDTDVWYNGGIQKTTSDGSRFFWDYQGKLYDGQVRGSNQYYPDLDGDGRADLHKINPVTNIGQTFFNICPGEGGANYPGTDDSDTFTESHVIGDPGQESDGGNGSDNTQPLWEPSTQVCQAESSYCDSYNCSTPGTYDLGDNGAGPLSKRQLLGRLFPRAGPPGGHGQPPTGKGGNGYTGRDFIRVPFPGVNIVVQPLPYPQWRRWLEDTNDLNQHVLLWIDPFDCLDNTNVQEINAQDNNGDWLTPLPRQWETVSPNAVQSDHVIDLQVMALFLNFTLNGIHLDGSTTSLARPLPSDLDELWNEPNTLHDLSRSNVHDYIMEGLGAQSNPTVMQPIPAHVNGPKGNTMGLQAPLDRDKITKNIVNAVQQPTQAQATRALVVAMRPLGALFSVYSYLNHPTARVLMSQIADDTEARWGFVGLQINELNMMQELWQEWWPRFIPYAVQISYNYAYDVINLATGALSRLPSSNQIATNTRIDLIVLVEELPDRIRVGNARPSPRQDPPMKRTVLDDGHTAMPPAPSW